MRKQYLQRCKDPENSESDPLFSLLEIDCMLDSWIDRTVPQISHGANGEFTLYGAAPLIDNKESLDKLARLIQSVFNYFSIEVDIAKVDAGRFVGWKPEKVPDIDYPRMHFVVKRPSSHMFTTSKDAFKYLSGVARYHRSTNRQSGRTVEDIIAQGPRDVTQPSEQSLER